MADALFSGLRRLIFKDEPAAAATPDAGAAASPSVPLPPAFTLPPAYTPPSPAASVPPVSPAPMASSASYSAGPVETDESTRAKAYQLLESINQPGVDFMEVWNAASDNGGASGLRAAFNALKYADKSLTKEKVVNSGRFYIDALQKALNADLEKKTAQQKALQEEKNHQRQSLTERLAQLERQLTELQNTLNQSRSQLEELDAQYAPRMADMEQKMALGKATIEDLLRQMQAILQTAEREL